MEGLNKLIFNWLVQLTENINMSQIVSTTVVGFLIVMAAAIFLFIARKILLTLAHRIASRTNSDWDDILLKHNFFYGVAHFVPATIIYSTASFASPYFQDVTTVLEKIGQLYYLFASVYTFNAFLSAINEIYNSSFSFSKERPIAGFVQLLKIFIVFVSLLAFISIVFNKDLAKLFTGLGAMAAILILVFRDSILGFVASIQISMNDMVKIGDWIDMPSRGADGTVIEINLATVKVENWDKTISNLPTYSLISESFVNWKGMELSGGRRIKRSINIDMTSVQFCSQEMLEKFKKFVLIKDYVVSKQDEIEAFNQKLNVTPEQHYNGRRQTNLGVFRKYLEAYLHKHPLVNNDMTFLVRHLQPTDKGLPVEIYVFCKDKRWAYYEAVQSDIFDHILAVIPEFELKVFQAPSGNDISHLASLFNK